MRRTAVLWEQTFARASGILATVLRTLLEKRFFIKCLCCDCALVRPTSRVRRARAINILHSLRVWQMFLFLAVGDTLWAFLFGGMVSIPSHGWFNGIVLPTLVQVKPWDYIGENPINSH